MGTMCNEFTQYRIIATQPPSRQRMILLDTEANCKTLAMLVGIENQVLAGYTMDI